MTIGDQPILKTIGTVARRIGVCATTVRHMEREADVSPYRTITGMRLYSDEMIDALCAYRRARQERKERDEDTAND